MQQGHDISKFANTLHQVPLSEPGVTFAGWQQYTRCICEYAGTSGDCGISLVPTFKGFSVCAHRNQRNVWGQLGPGVSRTLCTKVQAENQRNTSTEASCRPFFLLDKASDKMEAQF